MRVCKQCHRSLPVDMFRQNKSRSRGIYNVEEKISYKTLCKDCESLNMQAHYIVGKLDAGAPVDCNKVKMLAEHYARLRSAGYPVVTAAARKLLAHADGERVDSENIERLNRLVSDNAVLYDLLGRLRARSFESFDEADRQFRELTLQLKKEGLYAEASDLIDEWYMDE